MGIRSMFVVGSSLVLSLTMPGCASNKRPTFVFNGTNQVTIPYSETGAFLHFAGLPTVTASINGVTGTFIIDTGAQGPLLTTTAVRRCGIFASPSADKGVGVWGEQFPLEVATNVTVQFTPNFAIHYSKIMVSPEKGNNFGLLDYGTLRTAHAVVDMNQKTITLTQ